MHMKNVVLLPCDRRTVRKSALLAAAAFLCLGFTQAQAAQVDLAINPVLSHIQQLISVDLSALSAGILPDTPQQVYAGPSNDIYFYGGLYANTTGSPASGTIQLLPGSSIVAGQYDSGAQVFIPGEDNTGAPQFPPGAPFFGPTSPHGSALPDAGNYGSQIDILTAYLRTYRLKFDVVTNPTMTLTAGTFDENEAGGQVWGAINGYLDLVSAVGNGQINLSTVGPGNTPIALPIGSGGPTFGTWDGMTLTVNVNSVNSFSLDSPVGPIPIVITSTGVIVATVRVPEPSSMILCGFGVVGLLSYAVRARKRRALAA